MSHKRKTVAVTDLVARINQMIAKSPDDHAQARSALAIVAEVALHDSGNYRGFSYLPSEYLPADQQTSANVLRPGFDQTRVSFFLPV